MYQSLFFNKIAGLRPTPPVAVSEVKTDSIKNILCWYSWSKQNAKEKKENKIYNGIYALVVLFESKKGWRFVNNKGSWERAKLLSVLISTFEPVNK